MQEVMAEPYRWALPSSCVDIHGFECLHDQLLSMIKGSKLSNAKED